ncbi:MAG: phosphatidylserine/phosphatidylglycerophosphate/cardiolipin synthase family protein [Bacteroidales bacterium]
MKTEEPLQFRLISDPFKYFAAMLKDIEEAKDYIYLEIYRFANDPIGIRFRDYLVKKAKEGVKIKLLIDSWGASSSYHFFSELVANGAEVRFFKKIRISWDTFTKNHRRDHRKILVIDDDISYIGSGNISGYSLNWRESMFRIKGSIAKKFKTIILQNTEIYNKFFYDKNEYTKIVKYYDYSIIRDVPTIRFQPTQKKFLELINKAKKEVLIEMPYFLPGSNLRKALMDAAGRGVKVKVVIPKKSDVGIMDVLTSRYLGELAQHNVKIFFYTPQNLHAKIFMVDRNAFVVGSANFDYRSFRYQHEISLYGENKSLIRQIINHSNETLKESESFDYESWAARPMIQRFFERVLVPFRHFF